MDYVVIGNQMFINGDEVHHQRWDTTGTVHVFNDFRPDESQAEVQWHGINTADELELVADQLQVLS